MRLAWRGGKTSPTMIQNWVTVMARKMSLHSQYTMISQRAWPGRARRISARLTAKAARLPNTNGRRFIRRNSLVLTVTTKPMTTAVIR